MHTLVDMFKDIVDFSEKAGKMIEKGKLSEVGFYLQLEEHIDADYGPFGQQLREIFDSDHAKILKILKGYDSSLLRWSRSTSGRGPRI